MAATSCIFRNGLTFISVLVAASAFGAQRTFVATSGADSSLTCALTAPCRGFAKALTLTDPGGEIVVLDSGGYGSVTVNKNVTINSPAGVYAGISVFTGNDGVVIAAPASKVVLRGLTINGQGGNTGIRVQAGEVHIENVVVSNMLQAGIGVESGSSVRLSGVVARSNNDGLLVVPTVNLSVLVRDSEFSNNATSGIGIFTPSLGTGALVTVERSSATRNGTGMTVGAGATSTATLVVTQSVSSENGGAGVSSSGAGATVFVRESAITRNNIGLQQANSGVLTACGANLLVANGTAQSGSINVNAAACLDQLSGGTGTVTSVATGAGLTGGTITTSGTVSVAAGGITATELAANSVTTTKLADGNVTDAKIAAMAAGKLTGTVAVANGGTGVGAAGAAGNVLRSSGGAWASAPLQSTDIPDLSTTYVKNQTTLQAGSNFNISSNGVIGGSLGVGTATLDAALVVDTPNSAPVRVGDAGCGAAFGGIGLHGPMAGCLNYTLVGDTTSNHDLYINRPVGGTMHFRMNNSDQVILSANSVLAIDQGGSNNGSFNNNSPTGAGLVFGPGSGEGIASKRTAGGNQFGLDFYTGFNSRVAILATGMLEVDHAGTNTGSLDQTLTTGAGLAFGPGSGEGIASKRSGAGGGIGGLDFYTARTRRMFIDNSGSIFRANNAASFDQVSDARLKDIHGTYERGLEEVLALRPVRFNYKRGNPLGLDAGPEHVGVTAQALREQIPEAVRTGEMGYLSINTDRMLWTLVNAVKEEHGKVAQLREHVVELEQWNALAATENAELRVRLAKLEAAIDQLALASRR